MAAFGSSKAAGQPRAQAAERLDYGASEVRRTIFAFALMLVLPFFLSMPMMLYQRLVNGHWFDTWQLAALFIILAAIVVMLLAELLYSVRARLILGKTAVRFTLPTGLGPTPLFTYQSHDIPYHTIKGVELRREVFGAPLLPVVMQGAVVHTKDKGSIALGYVTESRTDPAFPFAEIAEKIARRAAVQLVDQRTIWRRPRKERALGYISEIDTKGYIVDPGEVARLNIAHRRIVLAILSAIAAVLLLGIGADLMVPH